MRNSRLQWVPRSARIILYKDIEFETLRHSRAQPLFMKGYDCEDKPQRPAPKIRNTEISEEKTRKRR